MKLLCSKWVKDVNIYKAQNPWNQDIQSSTCGQYFGSQMVTQLLTTRFIEARIVLISFKSNDTF
jgi:hypothetical protein